MPPDDARRQDSRFWLARAELDLKAARLEANTPSEQLRGDVMFHAPQAVEKTFKAFLAWHDVAFRETHNLEELGNQCIPAAENWPPPHRQPLNPQLGNAAPAQARRRYNGPWQRCGWKPRSTS